MAKKKRISRGRKMKKLKQQVSVREVLWELERESIAMLLDSPLKVFWYKYFKKDRINLIEESENWRRKKEEKAKKKMLKKLRKEASKQHKQDKLEE